MNFTNPNKFKEIMREEGLKNPEDIWDTESFKAIREKIEKLPPQTIELMPEEELTAETRKRLEKVYTFCDELSEVFKQTYLSLIDKYKQEHRKMSQKIVDYLLENNLILPDFTIANQEQAKKLLKEYNLEGRINEKNILLVFQLPKPLAQFWWKGGSDSWGDLAEDMQDTVIEWGHFYRELMPVVWETQGRHENENGLTFSRLNAVGEHDPKKYYYVWEISEWENFNKN